MPLDDAPLSKVRNSSWLLMKCCFLISYMCNVYPFAILHLFFSFSFFEVILIFLKLINTILTKPDLAYRWFKYYIIPTL